MYTNAGFNLRQSRGIPYYSCAAFESLPCRPWLRHGFSTRHGVAPDLEDAALVTLHQVHSDKVHVAESDFITRNDIEGDALVTRTPRMALAIKTADCFPLLIADPVHKAVGAVHSGWRGTLADILTRTLETMNRCFGSDPARLMVALGPGIGACCFEVGEEVARLFMQAYPETAPAQAIAERPGKFLVNLVAVLQAQLARAGVPPENQHNLGICTCCNTREFFSYRAEGASAGRMMSVIAIV
ncbi:MAG: peptidoglycan editing factor PgeF [Acidobacteriota bacterium]|jgi:YfiH family protein|nr:peptidoglycan editing factor PgeF [Acidobacteriota bacterium]